MFKLLKVYFTMILVFFVPQVLSCRSSVGGVLTFAASLLWGTCKLRNEIYRNQTKRNSPKRNEIYRNETKSMRNEINRNEIDRNETKRNGIIQNEIKHILTKQFLGERQDKN